MINFKTLIKSIDKMKLLLKFLTGEKASISVFNGDEETVIDDNDMMGIKSELERNVESYREFIESNVSSFLYVYDRARRRKMFPFPQLKTNEELEVKLALVKSDLFKDGEPYSKESINKLEELKKILIEIQTDIVSQISENSSYKVTDL